MGKQSLALVDEKKSRPTIGARCDEIMRSKGWQRGIIMARQQFRDDDRRSALQSAAQGREHEALSLHLQADQHEQAMDQACVELGRARP